MSITTVEQFNRLNAHDTLAVWLWHCCLAADADALWTTHSRLYAREAGLAKAVPLSSVVTDERLQLAGPVLRDLFGAGYETIPSAIMLDDPKAYMLRHHKAMSRMILKGYDMQPAWRLLQTALLETVHRTRYKKMA